MKNDKRNGSTIVKDKRRLLDVRRKKVSRGNSEWYNASDVSKMSVYRPTVRYAPVFSDYVNSVFQAMTLDCNQIIRAALFAAAHSERFYSILKQYQKKDVPLLRPNWNVGDHELWLEQCPAMVRRGENVNADSTRRRKTSNDSRNVKGRSVLQQDVLPTSDRCITSITRREGEISSEQHKSIHIRETGGIVIRFE
jgi:hypothetical protein